MASTQSKACCETPAIVTGPNYEPKGTYTTIDGMKTYVTGPSTASQGILVIYDIFGFFPQTLQGADILAHSDKTHQYRVFMPDFFEGSAADISWYPPDTEEKGKKLGEFFQTKAAPPKTVPRVPKVIEEIKSNEPGLKEWGAVGFCWGGKIVNLTSGSDTVFKAVASCHPAMVDENDARNVTIPFLMLPTQGENKEDVEKWEKAIKVKHEVEWYPEQLHGFMTARSDLKDPKVARAYEQAYQKLLSWFHDHL